MTSFAPSTSLIRSFEHQLIGRVLEIAEVGRDADVLLHRAADDDHLAAERPGCIEDLLDARDVAGEGGDDDPSVQPLHDAPERLANGALGRRVAGALGAGRIGQQAEHSLAAELGQGVDVGHLAVNRRVVELEVAGVDDQTERGAQGNAHRVGDRMADPEGGRAEGPELDRLARLECEQRVVVELMLLDLVAQQAARQRRGVDRHAREVGQDVGQPTDMVLVGVGDQERLDLVGALAQVGDVGHDEVDAEHLLLGEHQSAIDHDDLIAVLEHVHVLADLADTAERQDAQARVRRIGHPNSPSCGSSEPPATAGSSIASISGSGSTLIGTEAVSELAAGKATDSVSGLGPSRQPWSSSCRRVARVPASARRAGCTCHRASFRAGCTGAVLRLGGTSHTSRRSLRLCPGRSAGKCRAQR